MEPRHLNQGKAGLETRESNAKVAKGPVGKGAPGPDVQGTQEDPMPK
jgi:hypothetical protein